jgi:hypothetical protein
MPDVSFSHIAVHADVRPTVVLHLAPSVPDHEAARNQALSLVDGEQAAERADAIATFPDGTVVLVNGEPPMDAEKRQRSTKAWLLPERSRTALYAVTEYIASIALPMANISTSLWQPRLQNNARESRVSTVLDLVFSTVGEQYTLLEALGHATVLRYEHIAAQPGCLPKVVWEVEVPKDGQTMMLRAVDRSPSGIQAERDASKIARPD